MYEKEFDCNPKFSLCGNYRFFMYTLAKECMLQLEQHNIFNASLHLVRLCESKTIIAHLCAKQPHSSGGIQMILERTTAWLFA